MAIYYYAVAGAVAGKGKRITAYHRDPADAAKEAQRLDLNIDREALRENFEFHSFISGMTYRIDHTDFPSMEGA